MSISPQLRQLVRERAAYVCEYCGVSETNVGSELTIDHYHPQSLGGSDEPSNLLYCCHRCNLNKLDYWAETPEDLPLWNPRSSRFDEHILILADGTAYPITAIGRKTIAQLRLNRPQLVAYRVAQRGYREAAHLLSERRALITTLEDINRQQQALIETQRQLLEQQQQLIRALLEDGPRD
jgi:hypothetical protein